MFEVLRSIFIGAAQGVTEFLPISSSAHLVLIPYLFNWQYRGLAFDVALHFGTAIAIIAFFWRDWLKIIKSALDPKELSDLPKNLLWQILLATIPAGIAGYLLQDMVEQYFHSPLLIAINLAVFGLALWLVDKYADNRFEIKNIKFSNSLIVGLAQCIALIPGVSRSGITIVASRGIGLNRENAARFSFLLGTPAMLGAFALELRHISGSMINLPFLLATITSAIAGFLAIKFLLDYLKRGSLLVFSIYRFILAIIVIAVFFLR